MKYGLNDKPKLFPTLVYGLQWWIVSIPCVIIMGSIVSKLHFNDIEAQIFYLQKLFAITGLAVIAQIFSGHRLPVIIGPASVLLIGIIASLSSGIAAIYTAIFVGGILLTLLSLGKLLPKLQFIFTPRIVTVILILIAFTLTPVILKLVLGNSQWGLTNLLFSIIFVLTLVIGNKLLGGIWKSTTVLWGIILGSIVYIGITDTDLQWHTGTSMMPENCSLLNFPFDFNAGTILAFVFCFVALVINELGSIQAVGQMLQAPDMEKRMKNGVRVIGLSNILSGVAGVIGPVDYSMSPGVISATGCASRYTLVPAGAGLIACAFFPGLINLLVNIPEVVMGSILLYLMASQLTAGMQMLVREKAVTCFNSGIIIGLPLMIALLISFAPQQVIEQIPSIIRPIIGNGFVMGVITVLIMEHLIFRKDEKNQRN